MSQKDGKFQSKSKKFGTKPGGKPAGGKFGASKGRAGGKPGAKAGGRGDKFGGKSDNFGGKAAGSRGGFGKRFDGDRPPRRAGDSDGFRARRSDGDREERRPRRDNDGEGFRARSPRRDGENEGFRERKSFGERKPRRDDDRGGKSFGGKKFGDKKFGDRKPRRDDDRGFDKKRGGGKKDFGKKDFSRDARFGAAPYEASDETRRKLKSDRPSFGAPSPLFLFGLHAVRAALTSEERQVRRLLVTESGFANISAAYDEARASGLSRPEPVFVEKEDIDRLLPRDAVHQDVLLDVEPLEDVFLKDLLISAADNARVVILDQVTDPHNVGAILRSAAFFGADAVIVQKLHAPDITGTLAKAASGAVEFVPLVREVNLSRAVEQLQEAFFTCIGLDERGNVTMAQAAERSKKGRVAIVMGAEGDGLRRLVAEKCDMLAQLPTDGPLESLNVSNAAAVALYELAREMDA